MVTLIVKNRTRPVRCPFISGVNSRGGKQIYGANAGHGTAGDGDDGLKEGDLSCSPLIVIEVGWLLNMNVQQVKPTYLIEV